MTKKQNFGTTAARSAKKKIERSGSKSGRFFKHIRSWIIYLLAIYGAHSLCAQYNAYYRNWVEKYTGNIYRSVKSVENDLAPQPAIIIRNISDLAQTCYDNLTMGVPAFCDTVIDRCGYALGYSEQHEQPLWVSYKLTREEVRSKKAKRSGDFRADKAIATKSADPADYKGSFFDRGHLAPAADMSFSLQAMSESFYMSNMSPQRPEFNRGIWKTLEEKVRFFAENHGDLYVVSGPIFDYTKPVVTIGKNKVAVPDKYYKVLLDANAANPKAIGFILPHKDTSRDISAFVVPVDVVEKASGLDFFNALDDDIEEKLESSCDYSAWQKRQPDLRIKSRR